MYAVTNNHNVGKAPANGAMIEAMIEGEKVPVPPPLFARYRTELEPFAVSRRPDAPELFAGAEAPP